MVSSLFKTLTFLSVFFLTNAKNFRGMNFTKVKMHDTYITQPCCETCDPPKLKYISVDHGPFHPPFCGETCLEPSKFNIYHLFEPNLTKTDASHKGCAQEYTPTGGKYSVYNKTVTHGWPGILSVTLDLYSSNE